MPAQSRSRHRSLLLVALLAPIIHASQARAEEKHAFDLESQFLGVPLQGSDRKYAGIDGQRMKRWVEEQTAFSRQSRDAGNLVWGRIAGEKHDALTHEWVAGAFRSFGLSNVHLQEIQLPPQWRATSWSLTATGSGTTLRPASVFPALGSAGTTAGGLDLEAVWVGLGTEADFAGRDVRGKLAVIYSWPNSAPHGLSARWLGAMDRAVRHGAAAVLVNRAVPGNAKVIYLPASVPTMYIGTEDATALRTLMEQGPVKVRLELSVQSVTGLRDANVWGTLPGATDEAIFVKAHHDGFFEGALDNATGVATLLALAEHFSKIPRSQRRRTIHFISVGAHHGRADHLWLDNKVTPVADPTLVINLEHTALLSFRSFGDRLQKTTTADALRWTVNGSAALARTFVESFTSLGVGLYAEMEGVSAPPPPEKELPWYSKPMRIAPSVDLINSPQWVYHADNDIAEFIPPPALAAAARGFAKFIDGVNRLSREEIRWERASATASSR